MTYRGRAGHSVERVLGTDGYYLGRFHWRGDLWTCGDNKWLDHQKCMQMWWWLLTQGPLSPQVSSEWSIDIWVGSCEVTWEHQGLEAVASQWLTLESPFKPQLVMFLSHLWEQLAMLPAFSKVITECLCLLTEGDQMRMLLAQFCGSKCVWSLFPPILR